jgi:tellurite resistance protein TerC
LNGTSVGSPLAFAGFLALILALLGLDLGVLRRRSHQMSLREATTWTVVWLLLAVGFNGFIALWYGTDAALQFTAGYLLEEALSVDNVFVFSVIFAFFAVPRAWQQRTLFWGILGALVLRGAFVGLGAALIHRFEWVLYLFGVVLVITGIKLLRQDGADEFDPGRNVLVRAARAVIPVTPGYIQDHFFVRHHEGMDASQRKRMGGWAATPLFLVLLTIESSDVLFAIDSVPAVFSVTHDPFIVYTSNIFAILGLRSLYFLVQGMVERFHYLKVGLSFILMFIGGKMLVMHWIDTPIAVSLGVIVALLAVSIAASWVRAARLARVAPPPPAPARPPTDAAERLGLER